MWSSLLQVEVNTQDVSQASAFNICTRVLVQVSPFEQSVESTRRNERERNSEAIRDVIFLLKERMGVAC